MFRDMAACTGAISSHFRRGMGQCRGICIFDGSASAFVAAGNCDELGAAGKSKIPAGSICKPGALKRDDRGTLLGSGAQLVLRCRGGAQWPLGNSLWFRHLVVRANGGNLSGASSRRVCDAFACDEPAVSFGSMGCQLLFGFVGGSFVGVDYTRNH